MIIQIDRSQTLMQKLGRLQAGATVAFFFCDKKIKMHLSVNQSKINSQPR